MNIESKRLNLFPISNDEMRDLIENETIEELRQAYGEMLQGCLDHPEKRMWYAVWVMELKEKPGTIVGDFCFKGLGEDGTVEIGYGLRDGFCGNGYMTEALKSVSECCLMSPNLCRANKGVPARCVPNPSWRQVFLCRQSTMSRRVCSRVP